MSEHRQVVLVMCGSFNPLTYTHLRVLEMARDHLQNTLGVSVVGGLLSPVHDDYSRQKDTLIQSKHRVKMIRLTLNEQDDNWVRLWDWEVKQSGWKCTSEVLDESERAARAMFGYHVRVMLVCGIDMLTKMTDSDSWDPLEVGDMISRYGLLVHKRRGYDVDQVLQAFPQSLQKCICLVDNTVHCEVSSTEIRKLTSQGLSTRYLISDKAVTYIKKNRLYESSRSSPRNSLTVYQAPGRGGSTGDYEESDVEC